MTYEFEVPGKITGKGRPRVNSYTGIVYTPTKTKDYECLVEQYFLLKYPRFKEIVGRAKVTITAGITVASGCVIGANAVVTKDTEINGVYVGIPAKKIKTR